MRTRSPRTAASLLLMTAAALMLASYGKAVAKDPEAASPQRTEYPPPPPHTPPRSDSPVQDMLNGYAEKVQALGERPEYRASYAGVETDIPGNRLLVHRVPRNAAFDAAVQDVVPPARLWLRDVPHSADELQAGVDRVLTDSSYWRDRAIEIHIVGSKAGLGCVNIGVSDPGRHGTAIKVRYEPAVKVCLEQSERLIPAGR